MKKILLVYIGILIFSLTGCASINPLFHSETPANTETQIKNETPVHTKAQPEKKMLADKETQPVTEKISIPQSFKTQTTQTPKENPALRNYTGVAKPELVKAIENVLYLIDPADAKIVQQNDMVISYRYYSDKIRDKYISGYDTWVVTVKEQKDKSFEVAVMVGTAQDFSTSPNSAIQPKTPAELYFNINALDEAESMLFFERLEYFLGKNPAWRSCENIQTWVQENNYKGKFHDTALSNRLDLPLICGHNWYGIEDRNPSFLDKKK